MNPELQAAVEDLYRTFSGYSFNPEMLSCSCCVSDDDKRRLQSQSLQEISGENIAKYSFKAMTTWGSVADFKHYLPRLLELLAVENRNVEVDRIFYKLQYADWVNWHEHEKHALLHFFLTWWGYVVSQYSYFDKEIFETAYFLLGNIERLLSAWPTDFEQKGFCVLVDFVSGNVSDLVNSTNLFKNFKPKDLYFFRKWLHDQKGVLENGFFYYAETDSDFAEKVSNALYTLETLQL